MGAPSSPEGLGPITRALGFSKLGKMLYVDRLSTKISAVAICCQFQRLSVSINKLMCGKVLRSDASSLRPVGDVGRSV